jgi:DNA polymerase-3 subunit delta
MAVYFFWGDDDFRLHQAVTQLRDRSLDASWADFNYDKITPDLPDGPMTALNQAMTLPLGWASGWCGWWIRPWGSGAPKRC